MFSRNRSVVFRINEHHIVNVIGSAFTEGHHVVKLPTFGFLNAVSVQKSGFGGFTSGNVCFRDVVGIRDFSGSRQGLQVRNIPDKDAVFNTGEIAGILCERAFRSRGSVVAEQRVGGDAGYPGLAKTGKVIGASRF